MALKHTTPETQLLLAATQMRGLFTRVARKLGLDPSHVRRVALGERHSEKVAREIEREVRRVVARIDDKKEVA